jgi:hypothetical protein
MCCTQPSLFCLSTGGFILFQIWHYSRINLDACSLYTCCLMENPIFFSISRRVYSSCSPARTPIRDAANMRANRQSPNRCNAHPVEHIVVTTSQHMLLGPEQSRMVDADGAGLPFSWVPGQRWCSFWPRKQHRQAFLGPGRFSIQPTIRRRRGATTMHSECPIERWLQYNQCQRSFYPSQADQYLDWSQL